MKTLVLLFLCAFALISCGRGNDESNSSSVRVSGGGSGSAIYGNLTIRAECGTSMATVSIGSQYGGSTTNTMQVQNGGTFEFQLAAGTYLLRATAGSCQVSGQVQTLASSGTPYYICLGNSCKTSKTTVSETLAKASSSELPEGPTCAWGVYGCQGAVYSGSGNVLIDHASVLMTAKAATTLKLDLTFASGSNVVSAIPGLGMDGWQATAKTDGRIENGGISLESLNYQAQTDHKLLQFTEGFCEKREALVAKMSAYLKESGFGDRAVAAFGARWKTHMPPNPILCAYPQGEAEISKVVKYKSSVNIEARRLWFIIVPQLEKEVSRIRPYPKDLMAYSDKPKVDAFREVKKAPRTRTVANDPALLAEECGLGFFLER